MEKVKYLILGAGPAGLTFANMLKRKGEESFLILEKEKEAGGLCRSAEVDGSPLDIGGGHFLDVRRPKVCEFLFDFLPGGVGAFSQGQPYLPAKRGGGTSPGGQYLAVSLRGTGGISFFHSKGGV